MADHARNENLTNIEFLPNLEFTKPNNYNDIQLILTLVRPTSLNKQWVEELLRPLILEPIKKCWFRSEDWSHYVTVRGMAGHRMSYEIFIEPLIIGREICHNCDRKGCINPWHLFQGTHSDNMQDSRNKGNRFNISRRDTCQ